MSWTNIRRVMITACTAAVLLGAPSQSRAECALWDWMFGHGQTTYAPPYSPPNVCAPAVAPCGCAPAQCAPACQSCTPAATCRISYRPVSTVTYMPVASIDPCSGCAVTTYRPTTAWTYRAALVPYPAYQVGYAPVAVSVGSCGSCGGCAPCSGYSASCGGCASCGACCGGCSSCDTSYGGCSSCGTSYGGCSSCNAGVSGGYVTSGGCSSCASSLAPLSSTPLPGPGDMSRPPAALSSPATTSQPATIGPPTQAPSIPAAPSEPARTYSPGTIGAPISPSAPGTGTSPSGTSYRNPATGDGSRTVEPLRIDNVPSIPGPQLSPMPAAHPENENRTTARPVLRANYFQLLPSPPASIPAQLISAPVPAAAQHVDDSGWQHVDN